LWNLQIDRLDGVPVQLLSLVGGLPGLWVRCQRTTINR
jgi:hypothetical protein